MSRPHVVSRSERPGVATAPPEVQWLLTLTLVNVRWMVTAAEGPVREWFAGRGTA